MVRYLIHRGVRLYHPHLYSLHLRLLFTTLFIARWLHVLSSIHWPTNRIFYSREALKDELRSQCRHCCMRLVSYKPVGPIVQTHETKQVPPSSPSHYLFSSKVIFSVSNTQINKKWNVLFWFPRCERSQIFFWEGGKPPFTSIFPSPLAQNLYERLISKIKERADRKVTWSKW